MSVASKTIRVGLAAALVSMVFPVRPSAGEDLPATAGMTRIAGGRFRMGATGKQAEPNESPVHWVTLSPYAIDTVEVSVGAYKACVDKGACVAPRVKASRCTWTKNDPQLPINCVSYDEADRYCIAMGKRLPTEAEWELAARGLSDNAWPWGKDRPNCEKAVTRGGDKTADGCAETGPLAVGGHPAGRSQLGVLDMAGNVEEWVADWYDDRYPEGEATDPRGPALGTAHVLRGGSWLSQQLATRTTSRNWGSSEERGITVGFRCAR